MAYSVFDSTNMASTKYAERIFDAINANDIENGTFGYLNGLATGESVTYNFVAGTKSGLKIGDIVVADQPAWDYDECKRSNQRRDKFVIKGGVKFRARTVRKNDELAYSIDGFTTATQSVVTGTTDFSTTAVYVTIDSTTGKLVASITKPASGVIVGRIMRKRTSGATLVTSAHSYGYSRVMYEIKIIDVDVTA